MLPGIAVNPANVDCQQEYMAERTIQTKNNIEGEINVDQDLLGALCWGLLVIAASDTINNTINVHTGDIGLTPANHMFRTEGVDIQDALRSAGASQSSFPESAEHRLRAYQDKYVTNSG